MIESKEIVINKQSESGQKKKDQSLTNQEIIENAAKEHEQYMIQAALLGLTARSDQQTDRDQQGCA